MDKRYVHQWGAVNGPDCDDKTRHWTEIRLTSAELLGMLGCASGSTMVGLYLDRDGVNLTITADEHQEAPPCPLAHTEPPSSSGPS